MQEVRRNEFKELLFMNELMFVEHTDFIKADIPKLGEVTYYPKKNRLNIHKGNKWESDAYYFVKNNINKSKTSKDYSREVAFDNIEQGLLELIGGYLDSEYVIIEESINNLKDPVSRDKSELHIRMAKVAMEEYKKTIIKIKNMKTIILFLLAFTGYSQNTTIHFYYSSEQLTGAEIMFPVRGTDFYLGGGFSGAWDVKEVVPGHINEYDKRQTITYKDREEWCSLYAVGSTGFLGPFLIKYRGGLSVYNDKVTFNDQYTKIEKVTYLPLIGLSAMYSITDDFGIEAGFDNFNKATLGFTVKF